jgi:hypothetical protein
MIVAWHEVPGMHKEGVPPRRDGVIDLWQARLILGAQAVAWLIRFPTGQLVPDGLPGTSCQASAPWNAHHRR